MSAVEMRKQLIKAYGGGPKWTRKVIAMRDEQILAFWTRRQKDGLVKRATASCK